MAKAEISALRLVNLCRLRVKQIVTSQAPMLESRSNVQFAAFTLSPAWVTRESLCRL